MVLNIGSDDTMAIGETSLCCGPISSSVCSMITSCHVIDMSANRARQKSEARLSEADMRAG